MASAWAEPRLGGRRAPRVMSVGPACSAPQLLARRAFRLQTGTAPDAPHPLNEAPPGLRPEPGSRSLLFCPCVTSGGLAPVGCLCHPSWDLLSRRRVGGLTSEPRTSDRRQQGFPVLTEDPQGGFGNGPGQGRQGAAAVSATVRSGGSGDQSGVPGSPGAVLCWTHQTRALPDACSGWRDTQGRLREARADGAGAG